MQAITHSVPNAVSKAGALFLLTTIIYCVVSCYLHNERMAIISKLAGSGPCSGSEIKPLIRFALIDTLPRYGVYLFHRLENLRLSVDDANAELLNALSMQRTIRTIDVRNCNHHQEWLFRLISKSRTLESLSIYESQVHGGFNGHIADITQRKTIKHLYLYSVHICPVNAAALLSIVDPQIITLRFVSSEQKDTQLIALPEINAKECVIRDSEEVQSMCLSACRHALTLRIRASNLSVTDITKIQECRSLVYLQLSGSMVNDDLVDSLCENNVGNTITAVSYPELLYFLALPDPHNADTLSIRSAFQICENAPRIERVTLGAYSIPEVEFIGASTLLYPVVVSGEFSEERIELLRDLAICLISSALRSFVLP